MSLAGQVQKCPAGQLQKCLAGQAQKCLQGSCRNALQGSCRCAVQRGPSTPSRTDGLVYCRGVVHFDYVSGQGVSRSAAPLSSEDLTALLWQKCNLSLEGEREQSLTPEKQMMRLRMLAPLIAVNSTQVSNVPCPCSDACRVCLHVRQSPSLLILKVC